MSDQQGQEILQRMFKRLIEFAEDVQDLQSPLSSHAKNLQTQQQLLVKLLYARDFIHRHYTSNLKLKDIAHQSLLSKYHFHRLFRDCFQISPKDLQIQLRMKKAKELLAEYDLPIHSIAYQLGYVDTSAFSNQFKKYFHLTPLQYRTKL